MDNTSTLLDVINALNKISYKKYDCNIKQTIIGMKKRDRDNLKEYPNFHFEIDRAIYLCDLRNHIAHGVASSVEVSLKDIWIIIKVGLAAYFNNDDSYIARINDSNGACWIEHNNQMFYDLGSIWNNYFDNKDTNWLVHEILKWLE